IRGEVRDFLDKWFPVGVISLWGAEELMRDVERLRKLVDTETIPTTEKERLLQHIERLQTEVAQLQTDITRVFDGPPGPRRRVQIDLDLSADSWEDAADSLEQLARDIRMGKCRSDVISGGY